MKNKKRKTKNIKQETKNKKKIKRRKITNEKQKKEKPKTKNETTKKRNTKIMTMATAWRGHRLCRKPWIRPGRWRERTAPPTYTETIPGI